MPNVQFFSSGKNFYYGLTDRQKQDISPKNVGGIICIFVANQGA